MLNNLNFKLLIIILIGLFCFGCDHVEADQCIRHDYYIKCLDKIPKEAYLTPSIKNILEECETSAYYQSLRNFKNIKDECR